MINAFISECVELRTYNLIVNIIKKKKTTLPFAAWNYLELET